MVEKDIDGIGMVEDACIFCKIISGAIPAHKLYENEKIFAFLDINPLSQGHFLVVPKTHAEKLHQVKDDELAEVLAVMKKLAIALGVKDYNVLQNNGRIAHQAVFHVHFHLIPKTSKDGLGIIWNSISTNDESLKKIQSQIQTGNNI